MDTFNAGGQSRPSGSTGATRLTDLGPLHLRKAPTMAWRVKNLIERRRGAVPLLASKMAGAVFGAASVRARTAGTLYRPDFSRLHPEQVGRVRRMLAENFDVHEIFRHFGGEFTDYGLLSTRLVTDTGVGFLVDALQNIVEAEALKYHGFGTGTTNEAQADSALVTELTTEYAVNSTRPTGSQTETSANIYRSVGTLSPDSGGTLAITEHGLFSAASSGVLFDRSKFSAVNVVASADSLQVTYDLTLTAGG